MEDCKGIVNPNQEDEDENVRRFLAYVGERLDVMSRDLSQDVSVRDLTVHFKNGIGKYQAEFQDACNNYYNDHDYSHWESCYPNVFEFVTLDASFKDVPQDLIQNAQALVKGKKVRAYKKGTSLRVYIPEVDRDDSFSHEEAQEKQIKAIRDVLRVCQDYFDTCEIYCVDWYEEEEEPFNVDDVTVLIKWLTAWLDNPDHRQELMANVYHFGGEMPSAQEILDGLALPFEDPRADMWGNLMNARELEINANPEKLVDLYKECIEPREAMIDHISMCVMDQMGLAGRWSPTVVDHPVINGNQESIDFLKWWMDSTAAEKFYRVTKMYSQKTKDAIVEKLQKDGRLLSDIMIRVSERDLYNKTIQIPADLQWVKTYEYDGKTIIVSKEMTPGDALPYIQKARQNTSGSKYRAEIGLKDGNLIMDLQHAETLIKIMVNPDVDLEEKEGLIGYYQHIGEKACQKKNTASGQ